MEETGLYTLLYPSRIYIETTTRCNLSCDMCVKHSSGGGIVEGDFNQQLISSIEPALPYVKSIILNGIGEPLLYPDLEELINFVSARMDPGSYIGFQTNGMLVTRERARTLINSGMNLVCISMDASESENFKIIRAGGELTDAENAIRYFNEESAALNAKIKIGIEFVLNRDNLYQLVPALEKAAACGAGFAIVTHLIAYDDRMISRAAFDNNTDSAIELYEKTLADYAEKGIDIKKYFDIRWKFSHTDEEKYIMAAVEDMMAYAQQEGIYIHLKNVMNRDRDLRKEVERIFTEAEDTAEKIGMELNLPAVAPRAAKRCDFIESGSVFISCNGDVQPCHFLWHKYQCHVSGWKKYVEPRVFGNLQEKSLYDIWNDHEYVKFRKTVSCYDYPHCSNCSLSPCDYIYSEKFEQDCFTNTIPCCDCQWCVGIFQCLR